MDVKTIFLHGNFEEEIYIKQLDGFLVESKEYYVCMPRKILYDLKQAQDSSINVLVIYV